MEQKLESPVLVKSRDGDSYDEFSVGYVIHWVCQRYLATIRKCSRTKLPDRIRIIATKEPPKTKLWVKIKYVGREAYSAGFIAKVVLKGQSNIDRNRLYYPLIKFMLEASGKNLKYLHIKAAKHV